MDFKKVLTELYSEKAQVEKAIAALETLNGTVTPVRRGRKPGSVVLTAAQSAPTSTSRGRRRMSAAARKRISEGAKKRWAARKAGALAASTAKKPAQSAAKQAAPARHMSAAARKRISEAAKRRWAARKADRKNA